LVVSLLKGKVAGNAPNGRYVKPSVKALAVLFPNLRLHPCKVLEHLSCFQTSVFFKGFLFTTPSAIQTK
jgi:hypothetical protein